MYMHVFEWSAVTQNDLSANLSDWKAEVQLGLSVQNQWNGTLEWNTGMNKLNCTNAITLNDSLRKYECLISYHVCT